jgi:hypothetical protein
LTLKCITVFTRSRRCILCEPHDTCSHPYTVFLKTVLVLSAHLRFGVSSCVRVSQPPLSPVCERRNGAGNLLGEQCSLWRTLLLGVQRPSVTSSLFDPDILSVLKHPQAVKMTVSWDVLPLSVVEIYPRFIGTYSFHYRGDRPDDGGSKPLWNVGERLPDYTAQHVRRQSSSCPSPREPEITPSTSAPPPSS